MCGSLTSSDSHGPSAHLYVFAKYIQSVDGGNLAPLLQRNFFTAPCPLLNIGIENLQKQICPNDGNLAPPQTEQLSILKRGCGDASSSHRRCLLCRWCKISSIHSITISISITITIFWPSNLFLMLFFLMPGRQDSIFS